MKVSLGEVERIFNEIIDSDLRQTEKERIVGRYNASELGYCLRKLYFRYTSPKPPSPEELRIFKAGEIVHEWLSGVLQRSKRLELKRVEMPINLVDRHSGLVITGRIDNLVNFNGEDRPIEVKTCRKFGTIPKMQHVLQLTAYLACTRAKTGMLFYFERDSLPCRVVEIEYSQDLMDKLWDRADILHQSLLTGTPPSKESGEDWECMFCQYRAECNALEAQGDART